MQVPCQGALRLLAATLALVAVSPESAAGQQSASKSSAVANCGWPAGWGAGAVRFGTGYHRPSASLRVREVQRRLIRAGARPGPVDGLFGPLTRSAVKRFQAEEDLAATGVVGRHTLALLRDRTSRGGRPTADTGRRRVSPDVTQQSTPSRPIPPAGGSEPSGIDVTRLALLAGLLALAAALARLAWQRSRSGTLAPDERGSAPLRAANSDRRVLGYATMTHDEAHAGAPQAVSTAIGSVCDRLGLPLVKVVHDVEPASDRISDHPGLFNVLQRIRNGEASGIVVPRLRDLTGAVADLGGLLRWLRESGVFLVALDLQLDTRAPEGRVAARALSEVSDWERQRNARRTRSSLAAARSEGGAASRPSVRDDPELTNRIRSMRAAGMSLQAIADTLNQEGVPTLRGGQRWRPSSVQAAAGYKRPARSAGALPPVRRPDGDEKGRR
jgi:DNA invertase Pin-like site-specific DNA recombinase/peptidoglycan hydrolase-like protein with peptidoglycan-binding domain